MKKTLLLLVLPVALMACKKEFEEPAYTQRSIVLYEIDCPSCDVKIVNSIPNPTSSFEVRGSWVYSHPLGSAKVLPLTIRTNSQFPTLVKLRWSVDGDVAVNEQTIIDASNGYSKTIDLSRYIK